MNFSQIINDLAAGTLRDVRLFLPELAICGTIVVMLLFRIPRLGRRIDSFWIALLGSIAALVVAAPQSLAVGEIPRQELFTGLLVYDAMTVYFRGFLLLFAVMFLVFSRLSGIPDRDAAPDVFTLLLGSTLGMCLMASSNHLLMVFLAVEMASVPSYVLAGLLKGRRKSSEAALKYAVYGAGAAGVMLYGISLLAGLTGSAHLPTIAVQLADVSGDLFQYSADGELMIRAGASGTVMTLALAGLMMMVGLAFKLSAVPFHFWCPDVFEGATAEVNAFLSVASKAAALALLLRVALGIGTVSQSPATPADTANANAQAQAPANDGDGAAGPFAVAKEDVTASGTDAKAAANSPEPAMRMAALRPVRTYMIYLVGLIAAITCTFGNLAAYGQTNIKRLLAYSTIAHAGYMMLPVTAALAFWGEGLQAQATEAIASLLFYVGVYFFMNLGAFAIVAFLRNEMRSEEIADYGGLLKSSPGVVICFSIILFSLVGLPPLAGFTGKFLIFASLADAGLYTLLVIGGLNTVLSLFYYLRIIKVMTIEPEPEDRVPVSFSLVSLPGAYVVLVTVPVVVLFLWSDLLLGWSKVAVASLW